MQEIVQTSVVPEPDWVKRDCQKPLFFDRRKAEVIYLFYFIFIYLYIL